MHISASGNMKNEQPRTPWTHGLQEQLSEALREHRFCNVECWSWEVISLTHLHSVKQQHFPIVSLQSFLAVVLITSNQVKNFQQSCEIFPMGFQQMSLWQERTPCQEDEPPETVQIRPYASVPRCEGHGLIGLMGHEMWTSYEQGKSRFFDIFGNIFVIPMIWVLMSGNWCMVEWCP